MVSDTFHFALICTFIAIKIVSPLRGLKLDNAQFLVFPVVRVDAVVIITACLGDLLRERLKILKINQFHYARTCTTSIGTGYWCLTSLNIAEMISDVNRH